MVAVICTIIRVKKHLFKLYGTYLNLYLFFCREVSSMKEIDKD